MSEHLLPGEAREREYYRTLPIGTTTDVYVNGLCITMEFTKYGWRQTSTMNMGIMMCHNEAINRRMNEELPRYGRPRA